MKFLKILGKILGNKDIQELIFMLIEALKDKKLSKDERKALIEKIKDLI